MRSAALVCPDRKPRSSQNQLSRWFREIKVPASITNSLEKLQNRPIVFFVADRNTTAVTGMHQETVTSLRRSFPPYPKTTSDTKHAFAFEGEKVSA